MQSGMGVRFGGAYGVDQTVAIGSGGPRCEEGVI